MFSRPLLCALPLLALTACASPTPPPMDASGDLSTADIAVDTAVDAAIDAAPDAVVDAGPVELTLFVPASYAAAARAWAAFVPSTHVAVETTTDARAALAAHSGLGLAAIETDACDDCYRLERHARGAIASAGGVLGMQYGFTHALERMGYRFFHPTRAEKPATLAAPMDDGRTFDRDFSPEQRTRSIHVHTLHPIEALSCWVPAAGNLDRCRAVIDWIVRQRGNMIHIIGLNNIRTSPEQRAAWAPHIRAIVDEAHARGVRVGIGIQLFGSSNLQRAFDLLPATDPSDAAATIEQRIRILFDAAPFDLVGISFGEFSGVAPDVFIRQLNLAATTINRIAPSAELGGTIHVGNYADLRVTYMGETLLYYFLVKFADMRIVPWVHTTMYYDLYEDYGGAYLHDNVNEHRDYLLERLRNRQPVVYHPESAYWVAFDNSVPQYFPLYMRTRWHDLNETRLRATMQGGDQLRDHHLFSSGWEWGYWQTDAAVLRMGYTLPTRWIEPVEQLFTDAYGATRGPQIARAIESLGDAQHEALIVQRLAPYISGRDEVIDVGESARNVIAAPTRPQLSAVVAMNAAARATFTTNVVDRLDALATRTDAALAMLPTPAAGERWLEEVRDGMEIDSARAHFAARLWRAAVLQSAGDRAAATAALAEAETQRARGQITVTRRQADLHWNDPAPLFNRQRNATIYQYGYLFQGSSLCYWRREYSQLQQILTGRFETPPDCFF